MPAMSRRLDAYALAATLAAAVAFVLSVWAWLSGGVAVDLPWAPTLGLRLDLAVDGLGALYAILATGIGTVVFAYGAAYLPRHLEHAGRSPRASRAFWGWMVLFMGSMVGLALARDLVLMFVFFDLTAVASYFLIGFDRDRVEARGSALMALTVTGVAAVLLLIGAVVLYAEYGTFSVPELASRAEPGPVTTLAAALIAIAALAKSAQVPFHFWLPRAMVAPTPVSAYLHSAAMVAAGVLVLGRVHPLLALNPVVLDALVVVGFASIVVGGVIALAKDELKQILAHSTISQYGYVVLLYGIGGSAGAGAAALYVLAHAIAKSALFMTAGAVTEATGESRLSRLGGLGRSMPLLAASSAVVAGSLAALPLTLGFFKDELFFDAASGAGPAATAMAITAAALTLAYMGRFWVGLFVGRRETEVQPIPGLLVAPVAVLAVLSVAGGVVVAPFARLAADAAAVSQGGHLELQPAYHLDLSPANLMAIAAWSMGLLVLAQRDGRTTIVRALARAGDRYGPAHWYAVLHGTVHALSHRLHAEEVRDLRTSLAAVVIPTGILTALGFAATPPGTYSVGPIKLGDVPIVVLLGLAVVAAFTVAVDRGRLRPVLALSVLGFALAAVYAVIGAPDVALVAVLIETMLTLVFVGVLSRLPLTATATVGPSRSPTPGRGRLVAGMIAGASAFAVIWAALSRTSPDGGDARLHLTLAPVAHGGDVVTVILADFRGLDTMVEITVLLVATLGAATLLRRRRLW